MSDDRDFEMFFDQEDNDDNEQAQVKQQAENKDYKAEIYKKWFKFGNKSGFLSIRPFMEGGRFVIDIGEIVDGNHTNSIAYVDAIKLTTVTELILDGSLDSMFEGAFVNYGGSGSGDKTVSRLFKIAYWGKKDNVDKSAFNFKVGVFNGSRNKDGGIIPNMKSPISTNFIKVSLVELHEINKRLNLCLTSFAAQFDGDVFKALNGEMR